MSRIKEVRERRLQIAQEAAKRWHATADERAKRRVQAARLGPAAAETPERARRFVQRESLRAALQAREGFRLPRAGVERIIGNTFDLRDYPSSEQAAKAGAPVARFVDEPGAGGAIEGFGTGFLVSPRLMLTNHHVFPDKASAKAVAQFGHEHDMSGIKTGVFFNLEPDTFFVTSEQLDMSLVAVSIRSHDAQPLDNFGCHPLIEVLGKILQGNPVSIIQYPLGKHKQWAESENRLLFIDDGSDFLQYETDTLPGSSGSPVFNTYWEVVGLHHSGVPRMQNGSILAKDGRVWDQRTMSEEEVDWVANEGVRVSRIVGFLRELDLENAQERELIDELLRNTGDPLEQKQAAPGTAAPAQFTGGTLHVTVHGTANIYIGASSAPLTQVLPVPTAVEKAIRFDSDYQGRSGYNPLFLSGFDIPLPTVTNERQSEMLPAGDGTPLVLRYHHFSLAMNRTRRLQMWSAVNVDYRPSKRPISGREEFGSDRWKPDPRIPIELQLEDDEFYLPAKKFDRGHVVRRDDNAWGDTRLLTEFANSDTFHWTNCTPQHEGFNQSRQHGLWGQLEDHITSQSEAVDRKLTILAGPVLDAGDLEHDFGGGVVKVPVRFWKVAVVRQRRNRTDRLQAFGFILDQTETTRKRGLEALRVGEFAPFQVPLEVITRETGVVFPPVLMQNDTGAGLSGRRIESLRDLEVEVDSD
jgi:endonuclease G, mitochondrial